MTAQASLSYPDWKAPADDGAILIWPHPEALVEQTRANRVALSNASTVFIQGESLAALRQLMRAWIGHHDPDRPLIMTGHQAELHHPGVWAKNVLIDRLAQKVDGAAYHVAVDTDEPKHLDIRWPGGSIPLTDDAHLRSSSWSGLVSPPTPQHLAFVKSRISEVSRAWTFSPSVQTVLDSMQTLLLEAENLPGALTNALHQFDWGLGLRHHALLASPIFGSEPYLTFVHHVMANAGDFAADYNASLADYRTHAGIKSGGRPMPDLRRLADMCESPFWLDYLSTGRRERATLIDDAGIWMLQVSDDAFRFDAKAPQHDAATALTSFLRRHNVRLSPRALTLTMFLRMFVADQFVHGIGGAQYDQVTDRLMLRHFQLSPPSFSVTTATLYFPDAVGRSRACFPCVRNEGHHLRHNLLGSHKAELLQQIAAQPRRSFQRYELFSQMHNELEAAARSSSLLRDWQARREQSELEARVDAQYFDRELFYMIQPRARLELLIARYAASLS